MYDLQSDKGHAFPVSSLSWGTNIILKDMAEQQCSHSVSRESGYLNEQ